MKIAKLIERRQEQWIELEQLLPKLLTKKSPELISRFSTLYRAACADLALAEAYKLPPSTVEYLHALVAKSHNQFYKPATWSLKRIVEVAFVDTPQKIFADRCVHLAFMIFWTLFLVSYYLAYNDSIWPGFVDAVCDPAMREGVEGSFANFEGRSWAENVAMFGLYVINNTGIGLMCFASSILVIPGIATLSSNAVQLGALFGHMSRPDMGDAGVNFKNFVTAHGPFELTAIVLSAGAGLRLGVSWISTGQLRRFDSVKKAGKEMLPIAVCAAVLFGLAAVIEGFISPTPSTYMPWWFKGAVAVLTSSLMAVYFVILGYPRGSSNAT